MERPAGIPGPEEAGTSASAQESAAAGLVAKHYSMRQDHGRSQRQESFIIGLRQLNNWVKVGAPRDDGGGGRAQLLVLSPPDAPSFLRAAPPAPFL